MEDNMTLEEAYGELTFDKKEVLFNEFFSQCIGNIVWNNHIDEEWLLQDRYRIIGYYFDNPKDRDFHIIPYDIKHALYEAASKVYAAYEDKQKLVEDFCFLLEPADEEDSHR